MENLIIIGAGYHGRVLAQTIKTCGSYHLSGFLDDNPDTHGTEVGDVLVLGSLDMLVELQKEMSHKFGMQLFKNFADI